MWVTFIHLSLSQRQSLKLDLLFFHSSLSHESFCWLNDLSLFSWLLSGRKFSFSLSRYFLSYFWLIIFWSDSCLGPDSSKKFSVKSYLLISCVKFCGFLVLFAITYFAQCFVAWRALLPPVIIFAFRANHCKALHWHGKIHYMRDYLAKTCFPSLTGVEVTWTKG